MPYLNGMTCGVHAEAESFVERWFTIMTTHSGLLLDDSFLSGHIHHIEFHIQVCKRTSTVLSFHYIYECLFLYYKVVILRCDFSGSAREAVL